MSVDVEALKLLASLASISEFPFLIKNVALTQTLNTASIYGF